MYYMYRYASFLILQSYIHDQLHCPMDNAEHGKIIIDTGRAKDYVGEVWLRLFSRLRRSFASVVPTVRSLRLLRSIHVLSDLTCLARNSPTKAKLGFAFLRKNSGQASNS
jgi:hypothetical protein